MSVTDSNNCDAFEEGQSTSIYSGLTKCRGIDDGRRGMELQGQIHEE